MSSTQNGMQSQGDTNSIVPSGFILDDLASYAASLPNVELGICLIYVLLAIITWYIAINHFKWQISNGKNAYFYRPCPCFKSLSDTMITKLEYILIVIFRIISTFMCYIIYIHLRAKCTRIEDCAVVLLVPFVSFNVALWLMFINFIIIGLYAFLRFIVKISFPMVGFWACTVLEMTAVIMEWIFGAHGYSNLYMKWGVIDEGVIGTLYLIYLMKLPGIIKGSRTAGDMNVSPSKTEHGVSMQPIRNPNPEQQPFLEHSINVTGSISSNVKVGGNSKQQDRTKGDTCSQASIAVEAEVHVNKSSENLKTDAKSSNPGAFTNPNNQSTRKVRFASQSQDFIHSKPLNK
ncbi:uncharacterized protein VICG_01716 [Vittaforma corneae ATCC 50505]|uniref:Transmembrane protein n=1 Tax=Vittaforma corneae (strain ATCC 50505) TaxID=993615 RepID=L2GLR7_VITCO|nr:uncharacterized protein VICG_01716 [Vittaforma corneae ATCC 50505]ELA41227.1 hypothetical protein VICG_01716 [Vittaforma corneae ATCC 50505]